MRTSRYWVGHWGWRGPEPVSLLCPSLRCVVSDYLEKVWNIYCNICTHCGTKYGNSDIGLDTNWMLICKHFETFLAIYLHTETGTKYGTLDMGLDTKWMFICKKLLYKSEAGPCNIFTHYDWHQMWYIGYWIRSQLNVEEKPSGEKLQLLWYNGAWRLAHSCTWKCTLEKSISEV